MTDQHDHPIWQTLDKLQMDARAISAKIETLRMEIAALDLGTIRHEPIDSFVAVRRLIANGSIRDTVDLDVELRSGDHPTITPAQREELAAMLPQVAA